MSSGARNVIQSMSPFGPGHVAVDAGLDLLRTAIPRIDSPWPAVCITEYLHRANAMLVRLNLLLLMLVSFLPFPTRLLAEYLGETDAARVAATVYGLALLLVAVSVATLWRYAVAQGLVRPDVGYLAIAVLLIVPLGLRTRGGATR